MLSAGVGVRGALVKNIHIVYSLLVHAMLGVFFVVHTQPLTTDRDVKGHATSAVEAAKREAVTADASFEKMPQKQQMESPNAFMAIRPPKKKDSGVAAKMSLAKSLSESTSRHGRELEGMLQSISFEKQTAATVRRSARNREDFSTTTGTSTIAESIPEHVLESITNKFAECWTIPYDAQNPENAVVRINLGLDPHGTVTTASIADTYLYDQNPFYRAVADSALRAVYKCSPLSSLQAADYSLWNEMVLTFDTKHMYLS